MVSRYTFYDVLDNNKPVLVDAKHSEVCVFFGIKTFSCANYCTDGNLYLGRYRVLVKNNKGDTERTVTYSDEFRQEWEKECEWYRNFDWRKIWSKGVKRLVPGGKR